MIAPGELQTSLAVKIDTMKFSLVALIFHVNFRLRNESFQFVNAKTIPVNRQGSPCFGLRLKILEIAFLGYRMQ